MAEGVEMLDARLTLRSGQFQIHHLVAVWPEPPWESPVTSELVPSPVVWKCCCHLPHEEPWGLEKVALGTLPDTS